MPKFSFSAPTGQKFEITTPDGFTEQAARELFEKQLNTGSLVGLVKGDIVDAINQATNGLKSALSQLDPGDLVSKFPSLKDVPTLDPINAVKYIQQGTPSLKIGSLNSLDVQGLIAQSAAVTKQASNAISVAKGIGKFGFTPEQLEQQGLLKPGIAKAIANAKLPEITPKVIEDALKLKISPEQLIQNRTLDSFLTPAAWTGKNGIASAATFLKNESLQSITQGKVLQDGFKALQSAGITQALKNPSELGSTLMVASKFGVDNAAKFVQGNLTALSGSFNSAIGNLANQIPGAINGAVSGAINGAIGNLASQINLSSIASIAKVAQFAVGFASKLGSLFGSGSKLEKGIKIAQGFSQTVNRSTVNQAISSVIGNAKVPIPNFGPITDALSAAAGAGAAPGAGGSSSAQITPLTLENSSITSALANLMLEKLNDSTRAQQIQTANSVISRANALISQATALKNQLQSANGSPNDISLLERIIDGQKTNISTATSRKRHAEDGISFS